MTTFIPGARWRGKRLAIARPRHAREEGLPFPFGAEWPASYDITMDALVRELAKCQSRNGYLSAFPEEHFDRLRDGVRVWAPFYTLHKIMQACSTCTRSEETRRRCRWPPAWRSGSSAGQGHCPTSTWNA